MSRSTRRASGAANAGPKVMTLVSAMALGADCIDDCDVLRAGRTGRSSGTVRRRRRSARSCARSRSGMSANSTGCSARRSHARGRPVPARATGAWWSMSIRSSARSSGRQKQGAAFGYTGERGYHPILATRADTGEVLHLRLRKGAANSSQGCRALRRRADRPCRPGRRDRAEAARADSGFWNTTVLIASKQAGWTYSIGVRNYKNVKARIEQIPETRWTTLSRLPRRPARRRSLKPSSAAGG